MRFALAISAVALVINRIRADFNHKLYYSSAYPAASAAPSGFASSSSGFGFLQSLSCTNDGLYQSCLASTTSSLGKCENDCQQGNSGAQDDCIIPCGCQATTEYINCVLSYCWNSVYSCQYQALVAGGLATCNALGPSSSYFVPYFPAPENAPGKCSCNIGAAYLSIRQYAIIYNKCTLNPNLGILERDECICCGASGILSSLSDVCPNTNSNSIPNWLLQPTSTQLWQTNLGICQYSFNPETTCKASPLNFPNPIQGVSNELYGLNNLPPQGSRSITNGPGELGSPTAGTVVSWSLNSLLPTVATAVNRGGGGGGDGQGSQGSGSPGPSGAGALAAPPVHIVLMVVLIPVCVLLML